MKNFKIQYILILLITLSGCSDYVEIDYVGNERELTYTDDYRYLMNDNLVLETGWSSPLLSSDDVEFPEDYQATVSDVWGRIYTWQSYFYVEGNQDTDWANLYKTIYSCNVISDGVMSSKAGTEAEKSGILAEAKVHRAFAYLALVNMYAPHYNAATAASTKSVPLLVTSDLYTALNRATVENVYKLIISDLTEALPNLPQTPEFNELPSKAAAYALLARTYLYMGNYDAALTNAQSALDIKGTLIDLNDYAFNPYGYPVKLENSEIILSKKASFGFDGAPLSDDLLSLVTANDIRNDVYIAAGSNFYQNPHSGVSYGIGSYSYTTGINCGPSVPEMMLIKAECQARTSNPDGAIETINSLRAKRFSTDSSITLGTGESALDYVLNERRIELMGRGFRWFDMKRFNLEAGKETTLVRTFDSQTYTLSPNEDTSVYPIFTDYISKNPELGE